METCKSLLTVTFSLPVAIVIAKAPCGKSQIGKTSQNLHNLVRKTLLAPFRFGEYWYFFYSLVSMIYRFWSVYVQLIVQVFCLVLSYNQVVWATRGAHNPNLQVVITHVLHVCSQHSFGIPLRMNGTHKHNLVMPILTFYPRNLMPSILTKGEIHLKVQCLSKSVWLHLDLHNLWLLLVLYIPVLLRSTVTGP